MCLYKNRIAIKVRISTLTNEIEQNNPKSFVQIACVLSR